LKKKLLFSLILAFFLMSLCMSVSEIVAKEQADLQESKYVEVKPSPFIEYEKVREMVKNGSEVSITVILTFSPEINESKLFFHSDLKNASGHITIEGSPMLKNGDSITVNHQEAKNEVRIGWSGEAPEVNKRGEDVTLLNITQKITEEYSVIDIKRDVTSEIIEDAISAQGEAREKVESANRTIANATEAGVDVSEAKASLETANLYLNDANDAYWQGRQEDSIVAATNASHYAELAKEKAESAVGSMKYRNCGILAAVVVIAVVILGLWAKKRSKKRGIY
jgi:hypothetical protein